MGDIRKVVRQGKFLGWYVRYRDVDGQRKMRASHQLSKADARRFLLEVEARVARGLIGIPEPDQGVSVAALCERFLHEYSSPKIKDLRRFRRCVGVALKRLLPTLGKLDASRLTRDNVESAIEAASKRYRPNSVRTSGQRLQTVLNWAARKEIIPVNPVPKVTLPPPEQAIDYLSSAEVDQLLAELRRRAELPHRNAVSWQSRRIAVLLGLQLGLRRGEIWGLTWRHVDFVAKRVTIARSYRTTPKSGKPRHLPLPSDLERELQAWRAVCPATPEGVVCPIYYAEEWRMSSERADHGILDVMEKAGIRRVAQPFHILRHTFASHFVMSGGSLLTLQRILGHSDSKITMQYSHLAPDFLAQEMERVKFSGNRRPQLDR